MIVSAFLSDEVHSISIIVWMKSYLWQQMVKLYFSLQISVTAVSSCKKIVIKKIFLSESNINWQDRYSFWIFTLKLAGNICPDSNWRFILSLSSISPQILFILCQRRNSDLVTHSCIFKLLCFCAWKEQFYTPKIVTIIFSNYSNYSKFSNYSVFGI